MEAKKTPRTPRAIKTTPKDVNPEVKLHETHQTKHYVRRQEKLSIWSIIRIIIVTWLIIWAYSLGVTMGFGNYKSSLYIGEWKRSLSHLEHCKLMPDMPECLRPEHDPMTMSMKDMKMMLQGKSGATLEKAFLESMIPHHEWAVLMALMMTGSEIRPELRQLSEEIIASQRKEIDQMKRWLIEWGYSSGTIYVTPKELIAL